MKVYSGIMMTPSGVPIESAQVHALIAASSKAVAMRKLGIGRSQFEWSFAETGNVDDIRFATDNPGIAFLQPLDAVGEARHEWVEYEA